MGWPFDGEPRFVVRTCGGFIQPSNHGTSGDGLSAIVMDRAYCYRVVAEYKTEQFRTGGSTSRTRPEVRRLVVARAQSHADQLNAEHLSAA